MGSPGSLHTLLISQETTWGTAVDPAKDVGIVVDSTDSTPPKPPEENKPLTLN